MKKIITFEEFNKILIEKKDHERVLVNNVNDSDLTSCFYIGFDDSDFFIEAINYNIDVNFYGLNHITKESTICIYQNSEDFLASLNEKSLKIINTPFFKYRKMMRDNKVFKAIFLNELFESLKINRPSLLSDLNLKEFNLALREYGYRKAKDFLYLHLIIFCGEYINEKKGQTGHWELAKRSPYPFVDYPEYVFENGESTIISLNHFLGKDLNEAEDKNKRLKKGYHFKIESVLGFVDDYKRFKNVFTIAKEPLKKL